MKQTKKRHNHKISIFLMYRFYRITESISIKEDWSYIFNYCLFTTKYFVQPCLPSAKLTFWGQILSNIVIHTNVWTICNLLFILNCTIDANAQHKPLKVQYFKKMHVCAFQGLFWWNKHAVVFQKTAIASLCWRIAHLLVSLLCHICDLLLLVRVCFSWMTSFPQLMNIICKLLVT